MTAQTCHSLTGGGIETKGWVGSDGIRNISFGVGAGISGEAYNRVLDAIYSWNQQTGTTKIRLVSPPPAWQTQPDFSFVDGTGQTSSCGGYQPSTDRILMHPVLMANADPGDPTQYPGQVTRVLSHEVAHFFGMNHQGSDPSRITWAPSYSTCSQSVLAGISPLAVTSTDASDAVGCVAGKVGTNDLPDAPDSGNLTFDEVAEECYRVVLVITNYEWSSYHGRYVAVSQTTEELDSNWCGDPNDYPWYQ